MGAPVDAFVLAAIMGLLGMEKSTFFVKTKDIPVVDLNVEPLFKIGMYLVSGPMPLEEAGTKM